MARGVREGKAMWGMGEYDEASFPRGMQRTSVSANFREDV